MGMAASQARFLGLTARKSNVEYQGQQVNQQRTALANESANLYNQMMDLTVPTPPSTTEFNKTTYVLEGSSIDNGYSQSNYKIDSITKTYSTTGSYSVTLRTDVEYNNPQVSPYTLAEADVSGNKYTFRNNGYKPLEASYDAADSSEASSFPVYKKDATGNKVFNPSAGHIYSISAAEKTDLTGLDEIQKNSTMGTMKYFMIDPKGTLYYMKDIPSTEEGSNFDGLYYTTTGKKQENVNVIATLDTSANGRYNYITISDSEENNNNIPSNLKGKSFSLSMVQEFDENGYNDAFNEYQYQKAQYEQKINEINAKTEIIQHQDQQLELRLDQLDTEQNAIKTEMDSVTKVIDDNVEKTFKTFA